MIALGRLVKQNSTQQLRHECVSVLRIISDQATDVPGLQDLLQDLLYAIHQTSDRNTVMCIAGVLSNLTAGNAANKAHVVRCGGLSGLLDVIHRWTSGVGEAPTPVTDAIVESATCAIRHLLSRHEESRAAQHELQSGQGLQLVAALLGQEERRERSGNSRRWVARQYHDPLVMKALCGLVTRAALDPANRVKLGHVGIVARLVGFVSVLYAQLFEGPSGFSLDGSLVTSRRVGEDLFKSAVGALRACADHGENRAYIRGANGDILGILAQVSH